jgi:hypothetical protein
MTAYRPEKTKIASENIMNTLQQKHVTVANFGKSVSSPNPVERLSAMSDLSLQELFYYFKRETR